MFLHLSVILFTVEGGEGVSQHAMGRGCVSRGCTPPGRHPP